MNRIYAGLILTSIVLLSGNTLKANSPSPNPKKGKAPVVSPTPKGGQTLGVQTFQIHQEDNGKEISVPMGALVTLSLHENRTTGYSWSNPILNNNNVVLQSDHFVRPESKSVGAGGMREFRLLAVAPGRCILQTRYERPWEKTPKAAPQVSSTPSDSPTPQKHPDMFECVVIVKPQ